MAKIVNICLYGPVTDGWSYQDNLLPKYQKKNGNEVSVITSKWIWNVTGDLIKTDKTNYVNEYGIHIIRLDIKSNKPLSYKFKYFKKLYETLEAEKPDILFVHCFQFLDIDKIIKYVKKNPKVRLYVDNHCDFSNSATSWISKNILHKIIWKYKAKKLNPIVDKFYGVIPARVDFLINMYGLPKEKVELLEMGVDDDKAEKALNKQQIANLRVEYGINEQDFLIVTGGKIDMAKQQTLFLMQAVNNLKYKYPIKLLVFGFIDEYLKKKVNDLLDGKTIQYVGWINPDKAYEYFAAAELVVFPGRHSVFWEQVVGMGKPLIVKYWDGTTHVDLGGNVEFLLKDSTEDIQNTLEKLLQDDFSNYKKMCVVASGKGRKRFLYSEIARRSIEV